PALEGVDALYLNFITGLEMDLETARGIRDRFSGPVYADLHALFAGISPEGFRFPRELPGLGSWLRAFPAVQVNEEEFNLFAPKGIDPWERAAAHLGPELRLIAVTLGPEGSGYVVGPGFLPDPFTWRQDANPPESQKRSLSGRVSSSGGSDSGDPTGCGDVWGATFFARLLSGDSLEEAMACANRNAGAAVGYRGARGLHLHLHLLDRRGP
ncbi:MAG: carbohydrate kinase family protein, partial [Gemmatimonadetes bacterium]|nr:carbohydrate kinase family protein [Gemmatimonadota bacterium]